MAQTATWAVPSAPSGLSMRNTVNTILDVLRTASSGPAAPSPTVGGQFWFDNGVTPPVLRVRNNANTAWLEVTPETMAATTFWGNPNGTADKPQEMTAAQARSALGFPRTGTGLGQWTLVFANVNTSILLPSGGSWAWMLFKRSTVNGSINTIDAGVGAGGANVSAGAANQDMFMICWRIA